MEGIVVAASETTPPSTATSRHKPATLSDGAAGRLRTDTVSPPLHHALETLPAGLVHPSRYPLDDQVALELKRRAVRCNNNWRIDSAKRWCRKCRVGAFSDSKSGLVDPGLQKRAAPLK